jgi:serine/threonine-protein kinase RsbW
VGRKINLKLRSRIGYVDLVHEIAEDLARSAHFPKPSALNIGLAVREAVINAIKHGNNMDADKMVEVEFEQNAENFRIRVRDQGLGFDWTQTADPRADENLFLSNGRGIFFMKHFVDMVAFQHCRGKGTEVVLEKRLESAGRHGRSGGH